MARRKGKSEPRSAGELQPSKVTDEFWLVAERAVGEYPEHTELGGKWLIFVPVQQVDAVWTKVKEATQQGMLGGSAKAATARPNPNATNPDVKVICVYTYDCTDENDVRRVREKLRELGIVAKIPYKADKETLAGNYANRGHKRISKYYE
jgi:Basophilic leukemia-expressed protein Bles03